MTGQPLKIWAIAAGSVIGLVALFYVGGNILIPALSVGACWWVFTRLGLHRRLILPLAFAGGHGVWFLIGAIMTLATGGSAETVVEIGLEALFVAAIVAWGVISRSRPALCILIAYELVTLVFNVIAWPDVGDLRPILAVHMGLRIVAVIGSALALGRWSEIAPRSN